MSDNNNIAVQSIYNANKEDFEYYQRMAMGLGSSDFVPDRYNVIKNNNSKASIANCLIAIDFARNLGISPIYIMQSLYIVNGRPAWTAQFLIAMFNASGEFTPVSYKFNNKPGDEYGCYAVTIHKATKERYEGPLVTIKMAKMEGWYSKRDRYGKEMLTKWQTMPDLMLRYRAATFLIRTVKPELGFGIYTKDEIIDIDNEENSAGFGSRKEPARQRPARQAEVVNNATDAPVNSSRQETANKVEIVKPALNDAEEDLEEISEIMQSYAEDKKKKAIEITGYLKSNEEMMAELDADADDDKTINF